VKVVLRDDVENLGLKGDIVDVRDGYARNYLVPRGLAFKATDGVVKQADAMRRNREQREVRDVAAANDLAARLAARPVQVSARAGEGGKLFGSVTATDVATGIEEQFGITIDRHKVDLPEPLKELGSTDVRVRLHAGVDATVTVEVVAG
jgi:large subunit ribosomal protein L9